MPKDEFDFEDPMELNGMAFATEEDTTDLMAECFIEEFMRLGHNHKQVLALFRNPYYIGMHMVLEKRGEAFVKDLIAEIFGRWGRKVDWPEVGSSRREEAPTPEAEEKEQSLLTSAATNKLDSGPCDPMGEPIPKLNL